MNDNDIYYNKYLKYKKKYLKLQKGGEKKKDEMGFFEKYMDDVLDRAVDGVPPNDDELWVFIKKNLGLRGKININLLIKILELAYTLDRIKKKSEALKINLG